MIPIEYETVLLLNRIYLFVILVVLSQPNVAVALASLMVWLLDSLEHSRLIRARSASTLPSPGNLQGISCGESSKSKTPSSK